MDGLLKIRESVVFFYKKHETFINYILRFLAGLIALNVINGIGQYGEMFAPLFKGPISLPFLMMESILFMLLPVTLGNLILSVNVVLQVSRSLEVALFVFLMLALVLLFYSRLAPKKSLLIIAMIIGFHFKMPYAVVLFAGLYFGISSIIPITIATYIWGMTPVIGGILAKSAAFSLDNLDIMTDVMNIFGNILTTYSQIFEGFANSGGMLFESFVYAMAVLAVFAVSRLAIDYAKEISIIVGALVTLLGFIIGVIITSVRISLIQLMLFCALSVIIVEIAHFFDIVLEYDKAERVEFQDEYNYYYVKVIPKVLLKRLHVAEPARTARIPRPEAAERLERTERVVNLDPDAWKKSKTRRETIVKDVKDLRPLYGSDIKDTVAYIKRMTPDGKNPDPPGKDDPPTEK